MTIIEKKLTAKQKLFVEEYLIDLNASAAARRAGYAKKRADQIGFENLKKPDVARAIQLRMADREKRTEITQDRVLQEYARIAFLDPRQLVDENGTILPLHKLSGDVAAAIAGLDAKRMAGEDGDSFEILNQMVQLKVKFHENKISKTSNEEDIKYRFYIDFGNQMICGEIVHPNYKKNRSDLFLFFHRQTKDIDISAKTVLYTTKPTTSICHVRYLKD